MHLVVKKLIILHLAIILTAACLCGCNGEASTFGGAAKNRRIVNNDPENSVDRTIQYRFRVRNPSNKVIKEAEFLTYAPARQTLMQQCCKRLVSSHSYALESDEYGNQMMRIRIGTLAPFASQIIRVSTKIQLARQLQPVTGMDQSAYLGAARYVDVNHPLVRERAAQLRVEGDRIASARAIHEWVAKNIADSGYSRDARGAVYALENMRGDCTESMHLFIALARAAGIPARGAAGYVYDRDTVLNPRDYHNWAEFYDGKSWRVADPFRNVFMEDEDHYITMQILAEDGLSGESGGAQFWTNNKDIEISMK